ncbi:MAG: hypothetical protein KF689_00890 [Gemmatimonadaceae bacterium]|nr:hypothetical protein [Gemmatimonadaceae bacterium]MCW5826485.1 hypothetical protein [Gemmatimonadaceae bacterium]
MSGVALCGALDTSPFPMAVLRANGAAGCLAFGTLRQAITRATGGIPFPLFVVSASELEDVPRAVADLLLPELADRSLALAAL